MSIATASPTPSILFAESAAEVDYAPRSFTTATAARNHVKALVRSVGQNTDTVAIDQLFGELLEYGPDDVMIIDPGEDFASTVARFRWVKRR